MLLTLFFSTSGRGAGSTLVLLAIFVGLVIVVGLVLTRAGQSMHLGSLLVRLQDTTAEIRVRMSVLLLIACVAVAERFGLETILRAFLVGALVRLVDRDSASHPHFGRSWRPLGTASWYQCSLWRVGCDSICRAWSPSPQRCYGCRCSCLRCS